MSSLSLKIENPIISSAQNITSPFDKLARKNGLIGKISHFFGLTEKVWDSKSDTFFYYDKKQLARSLVGKDVKLSSEQLNKIRNKFIEIAHPFDNKQLSIEEFKAAYENFKNPAESFDEGMHRLEAQKQHSANFEQIYYSEKISEIASQLKPGDILVKKYHEDNPNLICDLQSAAKNVFRIKGYREAYKCSHTALYLGEIQGKHWVADAVLPNGNDPQIRRLQLDDSRFNLADKNQYMIIRNKDQAVAGESARLARLAVLKMNPEEESAAKAENKNTSYFYNHVEALRSLYHSNNFGFFAKQRVFKYYSDLSNGIPYQYMGGKRKFFCSEFVLLSIQMAELKKNIQFQAIIKANPIPKSHEEGKTGIKKFFARISYAVRKAFWSLKMNFKYSSEMDKIVKTNVDLLRTSPQDTLNHLLKNKNYDVIGVINKEQNRYK
ncbi:MAG: hypothetical protein H0W50_04485 [Parachlamydiaceae bacterium]|nr:hypothetical protein [Parachlamydiaceae bacterium]